eukprot:scaffold29701_cov18-Tisochrysis_lutea.AAC.1
MRLSHSHTTGGEGQTAIHHGVRERLLSCVCSCNLGQQEGQLNSDTYGGHVSRCTQVAVASTLLSSATDIIVRSM